MTQERVFSEEELKQFDGQEGRPAYVVYQGQVYDVSQSKLWRQGTHVRRHHAGSDLTGDLAAAPHDKAVLEREHITRVGRLAVPTQEEEKEHPLLDFYFDQHPHPVAVHFPVALTIVAAVLLIIYLLTGQRTFEEGAYHLLWGIAITAPLSILSGAISWHFNYGRKFTPNFRGKIGLGSTLVILDVIALTLRASNQNILANREGLGWLYFALVMAMVPVVAILGRIGALISFPKRK